MNKKINLAQKAYNLRVLTVEATTAAGSGHSSSCLSAADIVAVLFFHGMKFNIHNPQDPANDRFILSKGHAAPLLYAAYHELGVITHDELMHMRNDTSVLEGHPTPRFAWIDIATGSLGIGLSAGIGMALHARRCAENGRTFVLLGDSELAEGSVWEAVALGNFYKLHNLIAIVDVNRLGQRGPTMDEHHLDKLAQKFEAFGWLTYQVDGHDIDKLKSVFDHVRTDTGTQPIVILARTIKGYGIKHIEDKNGFHGKVFTPQETPAVLAELKKRFYQKTFNTEHIVPISPVHPKHANLPKILFAPKKYKQGESVLMRQTFGESLCQMGASLKNLICLDAEVDNSTYTYLFAEKFPERFIECFIAEQAMVSIAQGLAARGDCALVSTFSSFLTRAHDQLRMIAISRLAIRVVGTHAGTQTGQDGPSQMGLEDIALFRSLPNTLVLSACDAYACQHLLSQMLGYTTGISYLRLTRGELPIIYDQHASFEIGGFNIIRNTKNNQVIIIATGATVHEALRAYEHLKEQQISCAVVDAYCIKPFNTQKLRTFVKKTRLIITVEDHYVDGGLGDVITDALIGLPVTIQKLAVHEIPHSGTPAQEYARAGIDTHAIINTVLKSEKINRSSPISK